MAEPILHIEGLDKKLGLNRFKTDQHGRHGG